MQGWEAPSIAPLAVRLARKRKAAVAGYMISDRLGLAEDHRGIAISTYGKVIKRGWDWLGVTPAAPEHVGGLIEAPGLAECLTLNKADFIRAGARGATYLAYRKAIQEAVSRQLALWGDAREEGERARRRAARPVERDLEAVLVDLADHFPLLAALVERRQGGQRRLPLGGSGPRERAGGARFAPAPPAPVEPGESPSAADRVPGEPAAPSPGGVDAGRALRSGRPPAPGPVRPQHPVRAAPDDLELGRLVESTVWVNEAHPAYRRAVASRSEGYHLALATAMTLALLAVEPAKEHAFVTEFLARWGAAIDRRKSGRRRR